ncbi:unnamed protein product [Microthlaspi erraticum]|uniref:Integrase catalytic domain-containing protein n=1 Tax=Microthlaspi erraticum TaxID=1685480 RepID=A0A6D2JBF1_9BRAS|nr:unnamed protein product [Microthlaspi erraticum]
MEGSFDEAVNGVDGALHIASRICSKWNKEFRFRFDASQISQLNESHWSDLDYCKRFKKGSYNQKSGDCPDGSIEKAAPKPRSPAGRETNAPRSAKFTSVRLKSFTTAKHTSKDVLEYVHSDLWGSLHVTPSLSKCQYYISFVDDFSRKVWIFFLKTKDEAYSKFVEWLAFVENQSGKKLKALRTNNGLEYCNKTFDDFCRAKGIMRHKTCPYTPQQNGVAERLNRTILEKVRSLLSEMGLKESFWAEASSTVVYMINRTPSTPLNFRIPEEIWSGKKPEYSHMRRFGCLVYYHVDQGKLKSRAKKGILMGYPHGVKGYRIWSIDERKCIIRKMLFSVKAYYIRM